MASSLSILRLRARRFPSLVPISISSPSSLASTKSALHPPSTRLVPMTAASTATISTTMSTTTTMSSLSASPFSNPPASAKKSTAYPIDRDPPQGWRLYRHPSFFHLSSRAWNPSVSIDRRWASSISIAEDDPPDSFAEEHESGDGRGHGHGHDSESDREQGKGKGEIIDVEEVPHTTPKKKMNRRQKRKQSLAGEANSSNGKPFDVKFLHFKGGAGDNDADDSRTRKALEDDFDELAFVHDLSKFKWITNLEKSLILKLRQEEKEHKSSSKHKTSQDTDRVRDYWKVALRAVGNEKKVPSDLRDHFLNNMVVGAGSKAGATTSDVDIDIDSDVDNGVDADSKQEAAVEGGFERDIDIDSRDYQQDVLLLARGRELSVDNPLLWRRYSAKERKYRVRRAKMIVQKRVAKIADAEHDNAGGCDLAEHAAALLVAAEDKSTSLDFYLSNVRIPSLRRIHHEEKTSDQREREALEIQQFLRGRLPDPSYQKIIALVQTYVDCFDDLPEDGNDDGEKLVTLEQSPFTPAHTGIETKDAAETNHKESKQKKKKQFRVLLSNLRKALPRGRIHWIGRDVAEFFYVTQPDEVDLKRETDDPIASDPVLGHSAANWGELRDQYVRSFRNVQNLFLELELEQDRKLKLKLKERLEEGSPDPFLDPDDDDPSSERSVMHTFNSVTAMSRMDVKKTTTQRVKPRTYISLEAMALGDSWKTPYDSSRFLNDLIEGQEAAAQEEQLIESSESNDFINAVSNSDSISGINGIIIDKAPSTINVFDSEAFPIRPPVDRLVVIDSLPIDVTEYRLREAYGRCGEIEAIQIFHSRPDLDPGKKATDVAKKIRNASSSSRRQKWSRPRTPLYAMILYKDPKSAKKASCDPLRLFGMVLDQHQLRSHRASDMTTLFLEDVPSSAHETVSSIEFELNRLLQASDLYVCLDDSDVNSRHHGLQTTGAARNKRTRTKIKQQLLSYTIRFPSFEAAYWSYWKLSLELELLENTNTNTNPTAPPCHIDGPALHWMETPRDSHLYWTRKLNF